MLIEMNLMENLVFYLFKMLFCRVNIWHYLETIKYIQSKV